MSNTCSAFFKLDPLSLVLILYTRSVAARARSIADRRSDKSLYSVLKLSNAKMFLGLVSLSHAASEIRSHLAGRNAGEHVAHGKRQLLFGTVN